MKPLNYQLSTAVLTIALLFVILRQEKPSVAELFSPNAVLIKIASPIEKIEDEARLKEILADNSIIDNHFATVGSAIRGEGNQLFIIKEESLEGEYLLSPLGDYLADGSRLNFNPNYLAQRLPVPVQLITTPQEAKAIKADKRIYRHEQSTIGAALSLSIDGKYLNLISKETINTDYHQPIKLREYLKDSYLDKKSVEFN